MQLGPGRCGGPFVLSRDIMNSLFSVDGPLMRAMSDLLTLLKLNFLTLLCCLPVFTAGAAVTALHYCIMKMLDGKEGKITPMYFAQFRANLKSMTPVWLILLLAGVILYIDYFVFGKGTSRYLVVPVYAIALVLAALVVWIFPLGARFENSLSAKFKNAAIMSIGAFPRTLGMIAVTGVSAFVFTQSIRLFPLAVCFGISLPAYLCAFLYYPVIKKQIRAMTGEAEEQEDSEEVKEQDSAEGESDGGAL